MGTAVCVVAPGNGQSLSNMQVACPLENTSDMGNPSSASFQNAPLISPDGIGPILWPTVAIGEEFMRTAVGPCSKMLVRKGKAPHWAVFVRAAPRTTNL